MITGIIVLVLSLIICAISLVFGISLIALILGLILIAMPVLLLLGYLNGSLYINDKHIKPFYIK